jgi:hypothetical protein
VELHDLYFSPSDTWVNKSRRMRLAGHVARMREKNNTYRFWWEKLEEENTWKIYV